MATPDRFRIVTLATVVLEGRRLLPRTELAIDAPVAAALIREGKARRVDQADVTALAEAAAGWHRGPQTR